MTKWGVRSMVWYVFILLVAFFVFLYQYLNFINDSAIQNIFF